mmetsp:Transcript_37788/g.95791  ORF Transcript_37788/g.95791 Transcript_37788/m.95791 type:complete len:605 (-) Transcript_37788:58-1872(-)
MVAEGQPVGDDFGTHVTLFLQEVQHFVEDVLAPRFSGCGEAAECAWLVWLLRIALLQPTGRSGSLGAATHCVITGLETAGWIPAGDADAEMLIQRVSSRAVCCFAKEPFMVVIPEISKMERQLLDSLECLSFHCHGGIRSIVFQGPPPQRAWSYVYEYLMPAFARRMLRDEPQWALPPKHGPLNGCRSVFARTARVCAAARVKERLFLFVLREDDHEIWGVPGGAVARGPNGDRSFLDTARREWDEEVPCNAWADSVDVRHRLLLAVSKLNSSKWVSSMNLKEPDLSTKGGVSCTAWIFLAAREAFFLESEWHSSGRRLFDIREPEHEDVFYKCDAREDLCKIHTHGAHLMEHTAGTWLELDFASGWLKAPLPGVRLRADVAMLLQSRPAEVWHFFAGLPAIDLERDGVCGIPQYSYPVLLSTVGVREKLAVYRAMYPKLGPVAATRLLRTSLTSKDGAPYDAELVQRCLECGAEATEHFCGKSVLYWALVHPATCGPVAQWAAIQLSRAGARMGRHEVKAIGARLEKEEDQDRADDWRSLASGRPPNPRPSLGRRRSSSDSTVSTPAEGKGSEKGAGSSAPRLDGSQRSVRRRGAAAAPTACQ